VTHYIFPFKLSGRLGDMVQNVL